MTIIPKAVIYETNPEDAAIIAWFCIGLRREASRLAKRHRRLKNRELLILDAPRWNNENDDTIMADTIPSTVDVFKKAEETLFIRDLLSALTPLQKKVVVATVLVGTTEREVALKLGMSQVAIHQLKVRALSKLRKILRAQRILCQ